MDERYKQRRKSFEFVVSRLQEALNEQPSELVIDGVLHRFEFTFELAWKTMKNYLEYMGVMARTGSPREVIKNAFEYGIIDDGEEWIDMMLSRNYLSHIYDEKQSRDIYSRVKEKYVKLFVDLLEKI